MTIGFGSPCFMASLCFSSKFIRSLDRTSNAARAGPIGTQHLRAPILMSSLPIDSSGLGQVGFLLSKMTGMLFVNVCRIDYTTAILRRFTASMMVIFNIPWHDYNLRYRKFRSPCEERGPEGKALMFSSSYQHFTPAQTTLLGNSQCTKLMMLRAQLGTSADAARSCTQNRALLPRALCAAICYHPMALHSTSTLGLRTGNGRLVATRPRRVVVTH